MKKTKLIPLKMQIGAVLMCLILLVGCLPIRVYARKPADKNVTEETVQEELSADTPISLQLSNKNPEENLPFVMENILPGASVTQIYRVEAVYKDSTTMKFQIELDGDKKLAEALNVFVRELTEGNTLYDGPMSEMPVVEHELTGEGKVKTELEYRVIVTFDEEKGSDYGGQKLSAVFKWIMDGDSNAFPVMGKSLYGWLLGGSIVVLAAFLIFVFVYMRKKSSGSKAKKDFGTGVACMLLILTGLTVTSVAMVTYQASVGGNLFTTGIMKVVVLDKDGNLIDGKDPTDAIIGNEGLRLEPGMSIIREFKVKNEGTCDVNYKVFLDNLKDIEVEGVETKLSDALEMYIYEGDVCFAEGHLSRMKDYAVKASNRPLAVGEVRDVTIEFRLPDNCKADVARAAATFNICVGAEQIVVDPFEGLN